MAGDSGVFPATTRARVASARARSRSAGAQVGLGQMDQPVGPPLLRSAILGRELVGSLEGLDGAAPVATRQLALAEEGPRPYPREGVAAPLADLDGIRGPSERGVSASPAASACQLE